MILHEVPNPDADILITQGDAADAGAVLIAYLPFNQEGFGLERDFVLHVFNTYKALCKAYDHWPYEYINIQIRFNHDYINIK
jgi:hypothetical protein